MSVKITSATSVGSSAWIATALFMPDPLANVAHQLVGVVLPQVVIGHVEPGEPEGEQRTEAPGDHDPPEDPGRHPEGRMDVSRPEDLPGSVVAVEVAVGA